MAGVSIFGRAKRKLARWLVGELLADSRPERMQALEQQLELIKADSLQLKADSLQIKSDSEQSGLRATIVELQQQLSELKTELSERHAASAMRRLHRIRSLATLSETAIISDEGDVENTHGNASEITVGDHSYVRGRLLTYGHGGRISIGDWCYVGVRTEIWSMESISIGNRVLISHDVNIHDGTAHSADQFERHQHFRQILTKGHPTTKAEVPGVKSAPIVIEDDAWISFGVSILRGVTIGAGSIIAAGSIVTKDVPPGTLFQCEINPVLKPLPQPGRSLVAD